MSIGDEVSKKLIPAANIVEVTGELVDGHQGAIVNLVIPSAH